VVPKGRRIRGISSHMDILPTILDILGIRVEESFDGESLLPMIKEESEIREFIVCVENTRMTKRGIRTSGWKLIETLRPDIYGFPAGHLELYDVKRGETVNLAVEKREVVCKLMLNMEELWRRSLNGRPDPLAVQPISLPIPP